MAWCKRLMKTKPPRNCAGCRTCQGVSIDIDLMEPALFLPGHGNSPAILRATCVLTIENEQRVKKVSVALNGQSSILRLNGRRDTETVMDKALTLFDSHKSDLEQPPTFDECVRPNRPSHPRYQFQRGSALARRTRKPFKPGRYLYPFEIVLDPGLPESIDLIRAHVSYTVKATVERCGLMNHTIESAREVTAIRCPDVNAPNALEPISVARIWPNQFRYGIFASANAAPMGSRLPVAITLMPLSHVRCYGWMIYLEQSVRYKGVDGRLENMSCSTKALLLAGGDCPSFASQWSWRPYFVDGDGSLVTASDLTQIIQSAGCAEKQHPGDASSNVANFELDLPLPPCQTHASGDDSIAMHCDTEDKNVQVGHYLNV